MSAKYILRFDDICPTMNWNKWNSIEEILIKHNIKPILAIVPDNKDPSLKIDDENIQFWERVRYWQDLNWTIGLHGFQHNLEEGSYGLVPVSNKTEFVGSSLEKQKTKISLGLDIMKKNLVYPVTWVAPAHSFDKNTMIALKEFNILTISDGFHITPFKDKQDFFWIPQQLWRFRKMIFGTWTVCFHHNNWDINDLNKFERNINLYKGSIVDSSVLKDLYSERSASLMDRFLPFFYINLLRCKRFLTNILKRFKN